MVWHTEKVFQLARERGWSLRRLAKEMGGVVSVPTLSRVQHGRRPSLEFVRGVKIAFPDHDIDRLVWWEDAPPSESK